MPRNEFSAFDSQQKIPMPYSFTIQATEEDLVALKSAHQRIIRHLGGETIPLDMLALIALRSLDPEFLASEVLVSLSGKRAKPSRSKARS
jgi:hypothetical protein